MDGLTTKGLKYIDEETGEEKILPRANIQDGYKYTIEQNQRKEHLMTMCLLRFPHIDKVTVELMVDWYMNHPDDMFKEMEKDEDYMANFKSN